MSEVPRITVVLDMKADQLAEFFPLLQQSFAVTAQVGCTLDNLLSSQWEIPSDYVAQRVTTIFLNGRAIDDVSKTIVREGSVLALSGAMPGLVGATMRRGGYYAAMRGGITHRETAAGLSDRIATIRLKLFNLLLPELGPHFLRLGVILNSSELTEFVRDRPNSFWQGCSALVDGTPVTPVMLRSLQAPADAEISLTVHFED